VVNHAGIEVEPPDAVPFAQANPQRAVDDVQCSRAEDRLPGSGLAILRQLFLAVANDRANCAGGQIDATDPVVANVGHVKVAAIVECDAVGLAELGVFRGGPVSGVAFLRAAGDRRDHAGVQIDAANQMIFHLDEVHIVAGAIEAHFVRLIEQGFGRGAAVAIEACAAAAGDASQLASSCIHAQHTMLAN
jgi:hypothetical protein